MRAVAPLWIFSAFVAAAELEYDSTSEIIHEGDMTWSSRKRFLVACLLGLTAISTAQAATLCRAAHLRVNDRENPLGIGAEHPTLSWQMDDHRQGARQTAYEIRVASSAAKLRAGAADVWDSGEVRSAQSVGIAYDGPALQARRRYVWAVRLWDAQGHASAWSAPNWWEMGLLQPTDWKGHWIGNASAPKHSAPLLRHEFQLRGGIARARVYVTALGSYQLHLNGQRVGDGILTPGWTDGRKHVLYQTFDVTRLLHSGANVIGAALGDGWYGSPLGWKGAAFNFGPPPPRLLLQLEVTDRDGRRQTILSDGSWKTVAGPILASTIYDGETYDARAEQSGWDQAGFSGKGWQPVEDLGAYEAGHPLLMAQDMPEIRVSQLLRPRRITQPKPGVWVFDIGQNLAGYARLRVNGPRGTRVQMRFAEILNPDGTVYTKNLRSAKATDVYVLKGRGTETFTPHFTYHGFRYVEVTGYPGRPAADDLTVEAFHTALPRTGWIETSSPLVNHVLGNILWSQRSNLMSVPTDCPQRDERLGWMADAEIFWGTASFNMDTDTMTRKWMRDVVDAQGPNGAFSDVSPRVVDTRDGAPAWGDAGIIVPYKAWKQYNDVAALRQNWAAMEKWMEYIHQANPNLLWENSRNNDFGDWVPADSTTPKDLIATAYWAYDAHLMAQMAHALGNTATEQQYGQLFDQIRSAFQKKFVQADGVVGNGSQTCYAIALQMNLLPNAQRAVAGRHLVNDIQKREGHLSTGFVGTGYLLPALTATGHDDIAWKLLLNTTYPSWGYEVEHGGTSIWERWNGDHGDPGMNSYNHYAFGAVGEWIYRHAAGIDTPDSGAGFGRFVLAPHPATRLRSLRATYDSRWGTIVSEWQTTPAGEVTMHVIVPANTRATVLVPGQGRAEVKAPAGARFVRTQGNAVAYEVPAGSYVFRGHISGGGNAETR